MASQRETNGAWKSEMQKQSVFPCTKTSIYTEGIVFSMQNASPVRAWLARPLLTGPAADIKEDGVSVSLTQLPDRLVQSFCSTRVHLEKGIWRDAKFQAEQIFKDVWFSINELEG